MSVNNKPQDVALPPAADDETGALILAELRALRADFAAGRVGAAPAVKEPVAPANLSLYTGDDYPRAGCTLVVQIVDDGWAMRVYAPGYAPVGEVGAIERYASRAHGSTGIAVDAFIQRGADFRWAMGAMSKAERDYSFKSGSSVTV